MSARVPGRRQLVLLLQMRARSWRNAMVGRSVAHSVAAAAGVLGTLAVCAGAGAVSAPLLAESAAMAPSPGEIATPGGVYADVGFWVAAFALFALSFRLMEILYRKQDVRVLSTYPVGLSAQFLYRLLSALAETFVLNLAVLAFFVPIIATTGDGRAVAGLVLVVAATVCAVPIGFAVQLVAGVVAFGQKEGVGKIARYDAGGGAPMAFYFSPAAALVITLGLLLLAKLGGVDEYFVRGTSRIFWVGAAAFPATALMSLGVAGQQFRRHYPRLLARFYESDLIVLDTGYNYHKSVTAGARGIVERLIPAAWLPHYRKDALQLGRRYPMVRLTHAALWLGLGWAVFAADLAPTWLALGGAAYLFVWAAPWTRLVGAELEPAGLASLPVGRRRVVAAKVVCACREAVVITVPLVVMALLASSPATAVVLGVFFGVAAILTALATTHRTLATALGIVSAVGFSMLGLASWLGAGIALGVGAAGLAAAVVVVSRHACRASPAPAAEIS